ncbi:MAG TPA: GAF domain-containing sensor histidine kinase [Thermoanaerobaculia bacterium]|nr:GAF domain-containing sensor histidine kinase [Thermoanaerobaculia bacterium]
MPTAARSQAVDLESVLLTRELGRRRPRKPDHAAENRALVALAREMANQPRNLLQKLVDIAVDLCRAGSAGISLLRPGPEGEIFRWEAMAGVYAPHVGGTTPRDFSPCGTTLDRDAPQLFFYPSRYFTYFDAVTPPIIEGLVIPFYAQGRPLGTIWVVTHDDRRQLDAEDVRILTSLGELTSAALHMVSSLDRATAAHQALEQADRRKDEFLATLAHELRNPLAPIRNAVFILRFARSKAEAKEHALSIVERQVTHLIRLVDDLLEVSRITRGKLELRKERVDLSTVVRSAVETSRPLIDGACHELTVTLPAEPLVVEGDPVRLAQVIANLLNNAAKYTDGGGRIGLTVERDGHEATVTVRDNGIGISKEMLSRVFEMFTQADRSEHRSHGGLGIGLALVRDLVQMHGGRVEAHSAGSGQGSTFRVHLPL